MLHLTYIKLGNAILLIPFKKDLLNLAPQKPNWDLKRDIAKKLEKLDALTRRAITDMIRSFFPTHFLMTTANNSNSFNRRKATSTTDKSQIILRKACHNCKYYLYINIIH